MKYSVTYTIYVIKNGQYVLETRNEIVDFKRLEEIHKIAEEVKRVEKL